MKWMIASDIHGSAYCCEKMLEAFEREKAGKLLLLGDLLYHGPRNDLPKEYAPKKVIALLNERKEDLICVRGNCEAEVDQMVLEFPVLAESAWLWMDGWQALAIHGHRPLPPLSKKVICFRGHTHVPFCGEQDGVFCMNPGSVSIPKENSPHSYMTWEDGLAQWNTLEGESFLFWDGKKEGFLK